MRAIYRLAGIAYFAAALSTLHPLPVQAKTDATFSLAPKYNYVVPSIPPSGEDLGSEQNPASGNYQALLGALKRVGMEIMHTKQKVISDVIRNEGLQPQLEAIIAGEDVKSIDSDKDGTKMLLNGMNPNQTFIITEYGSGDMGCVELGTNTKHIQASRYYGIVHCFPSAPVANGSSQKYLVMQYTPDDGPKLPTSWKNVFQFDQVPKELNYTAEAADKLADSLRDGGMHILLRLQGSLESFRTHVQEKIVSYFDSVRRNINGIIEIYHQAALTGMKLDTFAIQSPPILEMGENLISFGSGPGMAAVFTGTTPGSNGASLSHIVKLAVVNENPDATEDRVCDAALPFATHQIIRGNLKLITFYSVTKTDGVARVTPTVMYYSDGYVTGGQFFVVSAEDESKQPGEISFDPKEEESLLLRLVKRVQEKCRKLGITTKK